MKVGARSARSDSIFQNGVIIKMLSRAKLATRESRVPDFGSKSENCIFGFLGTLGVFRHNIQVGNRPFLVYV